MFHDNLLYHDEKMCNNHNRRCTKAYDTIKVGGMMRHHNKDHRKSMNHNSHYPSSKYEEKKHNVFHTNLYTTYKLSFIHST